MQIPVLMYHEVLEDSQLKQKQNEQRRLAYAVTSITCSQFEEQMAFLSKNGYQALSLGEILEEISDNCNGKYQRMKKVVALTFDDGYIGFYKNVYPILKQYNFKATVFMIISRIGKKNYMNWDQLKELSDYGISIQSHSVTHKPLEILPEVSVRDELQSSKNVLEKKLNRTVNLISYPQGSYNNAIIKIAKDLGYIGSCITGIGYLNCRTNPFKINRLNVRQSYGISEFMKIVEKNLPFYLKLKLSDQAKAMMKGIIGTERYLKMYIKKHKIDDHIFSGRKIE